MRRFLNWLQMPGCAYEKTSWKEVMDAAMCGIYPSDEHLERMLDYLERTP